MARESKGHVAAWLEAERTDYADEKWDSETGEALNRDARENPKMLPDSPGSDGPPINIDVFIFNYLGRIHLCGLDATPGRQAMGKLIVTLTDHLERAVDAHGPMPLPGVPSGEIQEWDNGG